jgi:hypothetical protein
MKHQEKMQDISIHKTVRSLHRDILIYVHIFLNI